MMKLKEASYSVWLGLAVLVVLGETAVLYSLSSSFARSTQWVVDTEEVLEGIESFRSLIKDAETGQRGYILTGKDEYLAPYYAARNKLPGAIDQLRRLTHDNPQQHSRFDELQSLVNAKLSELSETIQLRRTRGVSQAVEVIMTGRGALLMDRIRVLTTAMTVSELSLLRQRNQKRQRIAREMVHSLVLGTVLLLALLLYESHVIHRVTTALLKNDRHLRRVVEATPNGLIMTDSDGRITMVNLYAEKLFGYRREELLGQNIDLLVPAPARGHHRQRRQAYLENPVTRPMKEGDALFGLRKDGSEVPVEIGLNPIPDLELGSVLASVIDRTERNAAQEARRLHEAERERAEQARRESEEAFRTLAECVPQLVWMCTADGMNTYFNRRWTEYTGLTLEQSYGTGWNTPFHPDDREAAWKAWNQALNSGEPYQAECRLLRADSSYHWFLTKALPMRDGEGRVVKWFGTFTDIDDLKRAQQEQLRSLQEKENLLKEVHHRVKNNLQIISSLLSLQSDSLSHDGRRALADSQRRVESMALVHEQLYRVQDPGKVNFGTYITRLATDLTGAFNMRTELLDLKLAVDTVMLPADQAIPCGLILNELITNALKYAFVEDRRGRLEVTLKQDESGRVALTVSDDGSGLPPGFDWTKATSLGLRIVQTLARQLNGTLEYVGKPGASFTLLFHRA